MWNLLRPQSAIGATRVFAVRTELGLSRAGLGTLLEPPKVANRSIEITKSGGFNLLMIGSQGTRLSSEQEHERP